MEIPPVGEQGGYFCWKNKLNSKIIMEIGKNMYDNGRIKCGMARILPHRYLSIFIITFE
jgi:hypothetical protein